ncbi:MAG TPA: alanine racemase, partial [Tepidisphaeraceae bacterium]|nr:alanine racemase [Tepidisphaeraceae bacterium]
VLLQVNASEEPQKYGLAVGAVTHLAEQIDTMNYIQVTGLMCMAKQGADEKESRFVFSRTREIFEEMKFRKIGGTSLRHLSMGMTSDFEWAIQEGSTMVRVGSAIFGSSAEHQDDEDED